MPRFAPKLVPTVAALVGVLVFGRLCAWQLRRMGEAAEARVEAEARLAAPPFDARSPPADAAGRRARVEGTPDWSAVVRVPSISPAYEQGVRLLVPVGGVRVDVGFVAHGQVDEVLAAEAAVAGPRAYAGLVRAEGDGWLLVDGEGYARGRSSADRVPPVSGWEIPVSGRPHGEYAATWAACALMVAGLWAYASFAAAPGGVAPRR